MTAQDILISTRDVLADQDKTRWSDEQLLRLLTEAVSTFVLNTFFGKDRLFVALEDNVMDYDLSPWSINISRVLFEDKVLDVKTSDEMDKINSRWESETGPEPKYIIFDDLNPNKFRIYPIPTNTGVSNVATQNDFYGMVTEFEITQDMAVLPWLGNEPAGSPKFLTIYCTKKVEDIATIDTKIDFISDIYKPALVAYVSGQALRLDADTLNRQFGAEQLQIFTGYVEKAKKLRMVSHNTAENFTIPYRGFQ